MSHVCDVCVVCDMLICEPHAMCLYGRVQVNPLAVVPQSFIPAMFIHAYGDAFIKIHHTEKLHAAYAGDKGSIVK